MDEITYVANGNQTIRLVDSVSYTLIYDEENRIKSVTDTTASQTLTFHYGGHVVPCKVAVGYDPLLGRFTSPDSIIPDPGSVIGYNCFTYVNNNPMIYTDPSGHCYSTDENEI